MEDKISLIIPLYNRETLIQETLASVAAQSHKNFECFVVDDGSTDSSLEAAKDFVKNDPRFVVFKRKSETKGACVCRNEGLAQASGTYVMFLDSDDLLAEGCLENRVKKMAAHPGYDFTVHQVGLFNQQVYKVANCWSSLLHENDVTAFLQSQGWSISSTFFRSSFVTKYRFDELAPSWQDVDFHFRILLDDPAYLKFPDGPPDVFIRQSAVERISNSNRQFKRMGARLSLLLRLENIFEQKALLTYRTPFLVYHFNFLEIAAVTLPDKEFRDLYRIWATSATYRNPRAGVYKAYLKWQNFLKKTGFRWMCGIFYRLFRYTRIVRVSYAGKREVPLKEPIILRKPIPTKIEA